MRKEAEDATLAEGKLLVPKRMAAEKRRTQSGELRWKKAGGPLRSTSWPITNITCGIETEMGGEVRDER